MYLQIWECDENDQAQMFGFKRFGNEHRIYAMETMMCMSAEYVFVQRPCTDWMNQMFRIRECGGMTCFCAAPV